MCGMTQCWGSSDVFQLAPNFLPGCYGKVLLAAELQLVNTGLFVLLHGDAGAWIGSY